MSMNTNPTAPEAPVKPWQIYMLRGERWIGVGACGSRSLAESQADVLRKRMRGYRFEVVWEGHNDVAA